jgi:Ankyrin repeats (3 copies)
MVLACPLVNIEPFAPARVSAVTVTAKVGTKIAHYIWGNHTVEDRSMAHYLKNAWGRGVRLAMVIFTILAGGAYLAAASQPDYWLQVAARADVSRAIPPLIALGANPSPSRIDDQPLWQAALRGNRNTVEALLDAGADIHASDDLALATAAKYGQTDTVRLLLSRGANFHARNDWALRIASSAGHLETVRQLLNAGADVHASDDEAVRWAGESGHADVVELLQMHTKRDSPDTQSVPTQKHG